MLIFISFGTEDVHYLLDCDMGRREKVNSNSCCAHLSILVHAIMQCMRNVLQLFVKNMLTLTT